VSEPEIPDAAEHLALTLTSGGLQRMAARVLALLLFTEAATVTMGEVAEQLGVSVAAVSGAIKTLATVGLVERVPAPGSRREHYRLPDDAWSVLFSTQNRFVRTMQQAATRGLAEAAPGGPAHRRLTAMRDFYTFLLSELPELTERWQAAAGGDRRSGTTTGFSR